MPSRGLGLLFVIGFISSFDLIAAKQEDPLKRFDRVRVDEHNFGKVRNLHINWYVHSIKALMGQLGKELYANLDKDEQTLLLRCLDKIEDSRDLVESARCLVLSRKRYRLRTSDNEQTTNSIKSSAFHESRGDLRLRNKTTTVSPDHFVSSAFKLDLNVSTPLVITTSSPLIYKPRGLNITVHRLYNRTANVEVQKSIVTVKKQFNLSVEKTSNLTTGYRQNALRVGPKINKISKSLVGKIFKLKNRLTPKISPLKISKIDVKPFHHKTLKPIAAQSNYYSMRRRYKRSMSWFGQKFLKNRKMQRDEQPIDHNETWKVKKADRVSLLSSVDKSPVSRIANLISTFARTPTQNETETRTARERVNRWSHTYTKLLSMKKTIEKKESSPGARVYSHRMYDLVLDSERPSMTPKQSRRPEGLVQMAMDLFSRVGGDKSRPEREKSNMKVLSPRFAPLMPDKVETKDSHLSPTFFAFYEEPNNTANIASIPQILKSTGMDKKDSEAVMATIMDVSGARDTVEDAMETLNDLNFFGIEGEIMSVTENMAKIYDKLESSMKKQQNKELDKRGFTFLNKHQLNKLYRDSALNLPDEAIDFEDYTNLNDHEREEALWKTIEKIAINEPEEPRSRFNRTRGKRDLTTPSILQPVVLAPYMFAPVTGLNVLGPTVLSPNIFSPLILNPAVLAPYVLSPAVAIPFIISPYLLSPYVLSPLVMAPFILNPYVLSPNVINPYVLSPLILSPLVLCPDVLSPMTLGGAILSPSVASPAVFTETFLMANILSPSFLS